MKFTLPNKIGKCFIARIHNRGNNLVISVSRDGIDWMPLIENLDVSRMHHNTHLASIPSAPRWYRWDGEVQCSAGSFIVMLSPPKKIWRPT